MKARVSILLSIAAVLCLALVLTGCGGGSKSPAATPGVTLRVGADTVADGSSIQSESRGVSRSPIITSQLDEGAIVTAYDFTTGAVVTTGTIGSDGYCSLKITPGLTVAIVITGKKGGKDFRLSKIVPVVPNIDTVYEATPESTIAAEAIAEQHFRKGTALDLATVKEIEDQAAAFVAAHEDEDFSIGGGVIAAANFGATGSLVADKVADVIAAVPTVINSKLVAAKNAVRQVKEVGYPLATMMSMEEPDTMTTAEEVAESYSAFADRFHTLLAPALLGHMALGGDSPAIDDLTMGTAYTVTGTSNGRLVLAADSAHNTAGQIIITRVVDGVTLKIIGRKTSASDWKITQTSSADALQSYEVTFTRIDDISFTNPTVRAGFSFKDKDYTTPLTFTGALVATGSNPENYSKITFDGKLTTAKLTTEGKLQVNFPTSLPSGAAEYDSTYQYPTSASFTNMGITMVGSQATIKLTGTMSATLETTPGESHLRLMPKKIDITGTYSNSHSGLTFTGTIAANRTSAVSTDMESLAGSIKMTGSISRANYPTYSADFTMTMDGTTNNVDLKLKSQSGSQYLQAAIVADVVHQAGLQDVTLTLTNQAGVQLTVVRSTDGTKTGTVKVDSDTLAAITQEGSTLKVAFTDSTFEALPFDPAAYLGAR